MDPRLQLPETIVLANEALAYCIRRHYWDVFSEDDFERFSGADDAKTRDARAEYELDDIQYYLDKLEGRPFWLWRQYTARRWARSLRVAVDWQLRNLQRVARNTPGHSHVHTAWLPTICAEELERAILPKWRHEAVGRDLVMTRNYVRWGEQGGSPSLGRYLAAFYEMKMPTS